ncbi:GMC family oxidoreductase N-terminal domain-containing protein [Alpinimonas psychrophila]|uniref:Choline dehydrogenase n=1 Tax=Alpinimonas psychrophila TaxID=748908 RepID=A0A7W3JTV8_9MICO|nr:GMC family oxidoreductase N-terminal domain-containing protein [Alpinimonas psychrophila]MBA8829118.1 choline dehydrogenase [Alpinimonas psychrophila]
MTTQPDVIIVGGGTAGSIIARRLVDAGKKVRLLEAGRPDVNPAIHDISRLGELWLSQDDWGYFTTPQKDAFGRKLHWPRGKVLGGSHSLNASIYVRGNHADFDGWEASGNPGWGWKDVLPVYQKIENYIGEASPLRSPGGLLDVTTDYPKAPIQVSGLEAAQQAGVPLNPDYNGESQEGVNFEQLNMRGGERLSTYRAYLHPIVGNANLEITTGAWVHRVIIEDGRAVGVEYEKDGEVHALLIKAGGEVVLCGGALDSPRVLLQSGIGPTKDLEALGINVVKDLPGVGENLHDHLLVPVIFKTTKKDVGPPPANVPITQVHWFTTSRPGLSVPDTQPIIFSVPMTNADTMPDAPATGFTIMGGLVTPKSRGTFKLSAKDPHAPTLQDPHILENDDDVTSLVFSVKEARRVGAQAALADEWGAVEVYPGADVVTDEQIADYIRHNAITYHHQVGTTKMGIDELAVVTPTLHVYGIEGLRVADASVMPFVSTGNTNAPSMVIGEKAAEFILDGK